MVSVVVMMIVTDRGSSCDDDSDRWYIVFCCKAGVWDKIILDFEHIDYEVTVSAPLQAERFESL